MPKRRKRGAELAYLDGQPIDLGFGRPLFRIFQRAHQRLTSRRRL
jgi:hypothetical protein